MRFKHGDSDTLDFQEADHSITWGRQLRRLCLRKF